MVYRLVGELRYGNGTLEACSVSTGGGMLGGHWGAYLRMDGEGNVALQIKERKTHADRERTTEYRVDPAAFDRIKEMVREYHLYAASRRPRSKMVVLDGDTTTLSFDYEKGDFSISDDQILSAKMREGFRAVRTYLYSLGEGEGVVSLEPQTAILYLKSGYTLQFIVADAFDGKLEGVLDEEREVSRFAESGIMLCTGVSVDVSGAQPDPQGEACCIVYDAESDSVIILYDDFDFGHPVYTLARLDGYRSSASPLIAEMEGPYSLQLN